MPEMDHEYVAIGVSQTEARHAVRTHHAVTSTAFWNQLARDFPKLRTEVDVTLAQRLESGRLRKRDPHDLVIAHTRAQFAGFLGGFLLLRISLCAHGVSPKVMRTSCV